MFWQGWLTGDGIMRSVPLLPGQERWVGASHTRGSQEPKHCCLHGDPQHGSFYKLFLAYH